MAIANKEVKKLETITSNLEELINSCHPIRPKEWDAFEKMVAAHKNLAKIDTDALRQIGLPGFGEKVKTGRPRKDCPRCGGTGQWHDPADQTSEYRQCSCFAVEKEAWPQTKKDWAEQLKEPAEVT
jgi:hypothetical protein